MGISGVGSFLVWSGVSLNYFSSSLDIENLALNRDIFHTLEAGMWGLSA